MNTLPVRERLARHYAELYLGDFAHLAEPMAAKAEELYLAETEQLDRDLQAARDTIADLKANGSPGVMHEVDRSFYQLAVKERDLARLQVARLREELASIGWGSK